MQTITELAPQVLALAERERASLASILLDSLPPVLVDEDEGVSEALRREAEMDADPSVRITRAEFEKEIKNARR